MSTTVDTVTRVSTDGEVSVLPAEAFWNSYGRVMRQDRGIDSGNEIVMYSNVALRYARIFRDGELFATVIPTQHEQVA